MDPRRQNLKQLFAVISLKWACAVALRLYFDLLLCINKHKTMSREIIFLKKFIRNFRKLILKCNLRYTSSMVGPSMRVKLGEHGKIFKTTSVTNLSEFSNNFLKPIVNDIFLVT